MKRPLRLKHGDEANQVGTVFSTPVVVKNWSWLPWAEALSWAVMSWLAGKRHPERTWGQRLGVGALTTFVFLGSEWCHNLAHAAAARWVGKPVDALLIVGGMPLLQYYDVNDRTVTPRQHILRALGGPLFNLSLVPLALLFRRQASPGSTAREVADTALGMNVFLGTASLLPIPGIDGGPILKWSLVERDMPPSEADVQVRQVNRALGGGLAVATGIAAKKRRWFAAGLLGMFAALALAIGMKWVEE